MVADKAPNKFAEKSNLRLPVSIFNLKDYAIKYIILNKDFYFLGKIKKGILLSLPV
jgi:hypothetical protein